jgi:hypothetical protein
MVRPIDATRESAMADTDQVHIRVTIDYKPSDNSVDTGYTVADWNALTDAERAEIAREIWETELANADQGGMGVETEDAEAI